MIRRGRGEGRRATLFYITRAHVDYNYPRVITTHTTVFQRPLTAVPATVFRKISISILRGTEKRARWVIGGEARRGEKGGRGGERGKRKRERERKGATGLVCGLLDFKPSPLALPPTAPTDGVFIFAICPLRRRPTIRFPCLPTLFGYRISATGGDCCRTPGPVRGCSVPSPERGGGGGGPPTPPAFE